jgi:hypothetical protein
MAQANEVRVDDLNDMIAGLTLLRDLALDADWAYPLLTYNVDSEEIVVKSIYDAVPTQFHDRLAKLGWLPDRKHDGFRFMVLTTETLEK